MRGRSRGAAAAALLLLAGAALAGCAGSDGDAGPDVTLPSSLSVPTTDPEPVPSSSSTSTTTSIGVPPTNPTGDGAPVIVSVAVEPGACVAGTSSATVTFEAEPQPPVRVFSVHLDGSRDAAATSATVAPITVPAVPCDGAIHTVLFIAFGVDGRSSTQAAAFRAPRP